MSDDLVGLGDIAAICGVRRQTVDKWRMLGKLPAPDRIVVVSPVWRRSVILAWENRRRAEQARRAPRP